MKDTDDGSTDAGLAGTGPDVTGPAGSTAPGSSTAGATAAGATTSDSASADSTSADSATGDATTAGAVAAGSGDTRSRPVSIDTTVPQSARMYDYFLGGKDNYPPDWEAAEKVISFFPEVKAMARVNRDFMHRASRMMAQRGISQFLDIGTGIPTRPNLHQVVQEVTPGARVVYADNDPIVLRHAEALLHSSPEGRTAYVQAELGESAKLLAAAERTLDLDRPVALSLVALLHLVPDEFSPYESVRALLAPLAPGSCLVLSHATGDLDPETWERVVGVYRDSGTPAQVRSREEFARFFDGLGLIAPGIELAGRWHPEPGLPRTSGDPIPLYVGVARKA